MHYAVAEWLLLIWDHLFVIVVSAVGIWESVSVGSIRRNSLLQKRPSPHSVTHIHTWRLPSKTAVWSVGHSWAFNAWLRSCFHSSPPRVILKPCDWTDNLWAAHIFFRPLFVTLDKGRSNLLRLVGKKHTPYILKFQIYTCVWFLMGSASEWMIMALIAQPVAIVDRLRHLSVHV